MVVFAPNVVMEPEDTFAVIEFGCETVIDLLTVIPFASVMI
jgi:hypothetical protein